MDDDFRYKFEKLIESERDSPTSDVPCIDCLCLGICKHKKYHILRECEVIEDYIYVDRNLYKHPISMLRLIKVTKLFRNPIWKRGLFHFLEIDETEYQIFFDN